MKTIGHIVLALALLLLASGCEVADPAQPEITTVTPTQLVLGKVAAMSASYTAGFQSGGLVEDFQKTSYPYLIMQQMGRAEEFEQPLVAAPGISSTPGLGPLKFENGQIVPGDPYTNPLALLLNATLARPYDNLSVPGSSLNTMLNTVDASSPGGNSFYDLILRNPNFGNGTQVDQLIALQPSLILTLLGGNDVLGSALSGEPEVGVNITPTSAFETLYNQIINRITAETRAHVIVANIPYVTALPFVNVLDNFVYRDFPGIGSLPVVFDATFQPVDFNPDPNAELYIPLLTEEGTLTTGDPVKHLLLPFLSEYQSSGLGVPDSAAIYSFLVSIGTDPGVAAVQAGQLQAGMIANGLTPSGVPIPANLILTTAEEQVIFDATDAFNDHIEVVVGSNPRVHMVDLISTYNAVLAGGAAGHDGVTALFVLLDPQRTAFSLDGFHPSDAGQALIAKAYLQTINQTFGFNFPLPNPGDYTGQYLGSNPAPAIPLAIKSTMALYNAD